MRLFNDKWFVYICWKDRKMTSQWSAWYIESKSCVCTSSETILKEIRDCSGIVSSYELRRMCFRCLRKSCDFCINYWDTDLDKLYRGCAEIVRKSCYFSAVQSSHSLRKTFTQFLFFGNQFTENRAFATWSSHGLRMIPVCGLCNASTMCLRADDV